MLKSVTINKLRAKLNHYQNTRHIRANVDKFEPTTVPNAMDENCHCPAFVFKGSIRQSPKEFHGEPAALAEVTKHLMTKDVAALSKYKSLVFMFASALILSSCVATAPATPKTPADIKYDKDWQECKYEADKAIGAAGFVSGTAAKINLSRQCMKIRGY